MTQAFLRTLEKYVNDKKVSVLNAARGGDATSGAYFAGSVDATNDAIRMANYRD